MTEDPNVQDVPEEPTPAAPPQPDLESAYRIVAESEGWDPRLTRFEMQDIKRKKEELDRKERDLEERARLQTRPEPTYDDSDPVSAMRQEMRELKRFYMEEREERQASERAMEERERLGNELRRSYEMTMRQNGITAEKDIDSQAVPFFAAMQEIYPEGIPEMIGVDGAIRNTFRFMKGVSPGPSYQTRTGPRQQIVLPVGQSGMAAASQDDSGPRRPNESQEEYVARLKRMLGGATLSSLPERAVINPG